MLFMRKEASLPVRLDSEEKRRLREVAERMGVTVSALIRMLVRSFADEYDRQGGRLILPPDWKTTLAPQSAISRKVAEAPVTYMKKGQEKRGQ